MIATGEVGASAARLALAQAPQRPLRHGVTKEPAEKRVVIVGGGCAGMAAAWELAKQKGYQIHVYEQAPRLGGKGSSTRADDGRILEHGLHVWMGWYENAFRMMRECYAVAEERRWGPTPPSQPPPAGWRPLAHGRFDDAFMPEPNVGLVDPKFHGQSVMWSVFFPPNEGEPGTPMTADDNPFTMATYLVRLMEMAKALVLSVVGDMPGETPGPPRPDHRSRSDEILSLDMATPPADSTAALINRLGELSKAGALTGAAALLQLVTILEVWLRRQNIGPKAPESTLAIAEAGVSQARKLLRDLVGADPRLRMKTEVIDIVLTIMIGLFSDRVVFSKDGLDAINDYDYREWLRLHGATKTSLESRFIRAAYDFAFAYEHGNLEKPRLAAGVALRGGFRMFFTYRGAAFWRMCSGMGDAVFAPLHEVLEAWQQENRPKPEEKHIAEAAAKAAAERAKAPFRARRRPLPPKLQSPVFFHFGHELRKARFDAEGLSILELEFACADTIEPPVQSGGWPDEAKGTPPDSPVKRLKRRDQSSQPLQDGEFDLVIIATGVLDFQEVFVEPYAPEGAAHAETSERGKAKGKARDIARVMPPPAGPDPAVREVWTLATGLTKTIATKSAQVWLRKDLYRLGWRRGSGIFTCMGRETFDTYADMTHLLPTEAWAARNGHVPKWRSIAYFCNPLHEKHGHPSTDVGTPRRRTDLGRLRRRVAEDLVKLVTEEMDAFWPNLFRKSLTAPADRRWEWLRRLSRGVAKQYVRVNAEGSERYTLSLPGSIASRVSPLYDGIDNMTVAGDWTACGLDCGCVEAAVMSGMLAAAAISGTPKISDIVGYDQP